MRRITVLGTPGAGKTTLAQQLAAALQYPFVELDALFWGPNWTPETPERFRDKVTRALAGECWTVGGNYSVARDIIWGRSDTLIWLDYPLPLTLWRLYRRTMKRILTREELWSGNRETWQGAFFDKDSLFLFAIKSHAKRRRDFPRELAQPEYAHLYTLRFRRPSETQQWLCQFFLPEK